LDIYWNTEDTCFDPVGSLSGWLPEHTKGSIKVKIKVKFILEQATKAQKGE
jgi:hypothetical protein